MVEQVKKTAGKVISFAFIAFFLALGVLGILLPILPGLVFLLIAALIAARHFPPLEFLLKQNRHCAKCLRVGDRFFAMDIWDKARLCFWATLKFTVDSAEWTAGFLGRQFRNVRIRVFK